MTKKLNVARVERMIAVVDAGLAVLATRAKLDNAYEDCRAHQSAAVAILNSLQNEHGAAFNAGGAGYSLRLADIQSSCTSGASGLLTNWINAARRRLDAVAEDRP